MSRLPLFARSSPSVATALSFLWPGLGQYVAGRRRPGILFAAPVALAALAILVQAAGGIEKLALLLITPSSALTVLVLVVLLGVWRLLAMADALVGVPGVARPARRRGLAVFAVLGLAVVLTHAWLGYVAWSFWDAGSRVFVAESNPDATPRPTPGQGTPIPGSNAPGTPDPTPDDEYLATPLVTPPTRESRINILFTGIDSAETRTHALTDTLLVASVDPVTGDVALISFPRDIAEFPIWKGGTYVGKINSFMTWARTHRDLYPEGPLPSLQLQLGYLLGAPIHYYAAVDLAGFRRMINVVGGVTITNERLIDDPRYDWLDGTRGFRLTPGTHTLNGRNALAYVRSRYSAGDNDFNRARRQQEVLLALRSALTSPAMLPRIPDIVQAAGDTVRTNFPSDRVGEMLELSQAMDDGRIRQVVLGPPYSYHPPTSSTGGVYILRLDMDRLAKLSIDLFGEESRYFAGG